MRRLQAVLFTGLITVVLLTSAMSKAAYAYDNDTHYVFTYYLAITAGYTPDEARRVASADVSIDIDPNTEPFQLERIIDPSDSAQNARVHFHAFLDTRVWLRNGGGLFGGEEAAEENKREVEAALRLQCVNNGNLGPYLHYYQDSYSHAGYYSFRGHALDGHAPDFLSTDESKARQMTQGTLELLGQYRKLYLRADPPNYDINKVYDVLHQLVLANPSPNVGSTYWSSPDWEKARNIVNRALGSQVPEWIVYHFDTDGNPLPDPNWRVFRTLPVTQKISLQSRANGKFVTADPQGQAPLIANAGSIGREQVFRVVGQGNGNVALLAVTNNMYVSAKKNGSDPLTNDRPAVGNATTFKWSNNADGTVSLQAVANSKYVTAEDHGAKPLVANRPSIGQWESFVVVYRSAPTR